MMSDLMTWKPIETAPQDGTHILLWCPKQNVVIGGSWQCVDGGGHPENGPEIFWWVSDEDLITFDDGPHDMPTHWMMMPNLPTRESA